MLAKLIYLIISFVISAIPLHIAVSLLEGKSTWFKAIFVNFLVAIASFLIELKINKFSGLISFLLLLLIYKIMFRMGWFRSFVAWLLQLGIITLGWAGIYWIAGIELF
ncbi:hypothetical protein HY636_02735 [Candidatus Woesearchaeota archaeon]|nr:hypothetical protein [Candidatus Woesearchaeota archaeon]